MTNHAVERREFLRLLGAFGVAGALPGTAFARAPAAAWPNIRAALDRFSTRLPGVAASIGRGTSPANFMFAGTIARDSNVKVGPDTLWRAYSMTKPVTGIAAMLLLEEAKLRLDQNIADFIPSFANLKVAIDPLKGLDSRPAAGPITVRHLLTHTSGLGYSFMLPPAMQAAYVDAGLTPFNFGEGGAFKPGATPDLATFADRLANVPLLFDPGTKWNYSVGLDLLGRVIEVASGMPFNRFVQDRLFNPLGMRRTFWQVPASEARHLTTLYGASGDGLTTSDARSSSVYLKPPAFAFGGAGLVTTPYDYDRFLLMLLGRGAIGGSRIMRPETAALAMSNLLPQGVEYMPGAGFGAGGFVVLNKSSEGQYAHRGVGSFGWSGAASTSGWVDPEHGVRITAWAQYLSDDGWWAAFNKAVYEDLA